MKTNINIFNNLNESLERELNNKRKFREVVKSRKEKKLIESAKLNEEEYSFEEIITRMSNATDYSELYDTASLIKNDSLRTDVENMLDTCENDGDTVEEAYSIVTSDILDMYVNDLNEAENNLVLNRDKIANFLKEAVESLTTSNYTCSEYKLDNNLSLFVGWSDGYAEDDDSVIHDEKEPTFAINAGIKGNEDYLKTDYDFLNFPFDKETGDAWDSGISISPNEDYSKLADWFIKEYKGIRKALDNGEIILEYKEEPKENPLNEDNSNISDLANEIINFYDSDMGTHFDEVLGNEEEIYNETLAMLENKEDNKEVIKRIISEIRDSETDEELANKLEAYLNESALKEEDIIKINQTDTEPDYLIQDVTVLDQIGDGDVQSPDIEALLTLVDSELKESYSEDWGHIKTLSSKIDENTSYALVDISTPEILKELDSRGIKDAAIGKNLILEKVNNKLVEFKVNNLNGTTKYSKKTTNPQKAIYEWIESEFLQEAKEEKAKEAEVARVKTEKETVENYINNRLDLRMEIENIKMFIELSKEVKAEEEMKPTIQNRMYAFAAEVPHQIEVNNNDNKYELSFSTLDEVVTIVFGKEWVKEPTPDNEIVGVIKEAARPDISASIVQYMYNKYPEANYYKDAMSGDDMIIFFDKLTDEMKKDLKDKYGDRISFGTSQSQYAPEQKSKVVIINDYKHNRKINESQKINEATVKDLWNYLESKPNLKYITKIKNPQEFSDMLNIEAKKDKDLYKLLHDKLLPDSQKMNEGYYVLERKAGDQVWYDIIDTAQGIAVNRTPFDSREEANDWIKKKSSKKSINESYEQFNIGEIEVVFNPDTYETLYSIPSADVQDKKINLTKVPTVDTPYDTDTIIKSYIETRFGRIPSEEEKEMADDEEVPEPQPEEEIPQDDINIDEPDLTEDELPDEPEENEVPDEVEPEEETPEAETGSAVFMKVRPKQEVSIETLRNKQLEGDTPTSNYIVVDTIDLMNAEFEELSNDLSQPKSWLEGLQAIDRKNYSFNVIKATNANSNYDILIDPLGYNYPRYVAIVDK